MISLKPFLKLQTNKNDNLEPPRHMAMLEPSLLVPSSSPEAFRWWKWNTAVVTMKAGKVKGVKLARRFEDIDMGRVCID